MKKIEIQQNSTEWEELRRGKIGASDVAIIMTGSEHDRYDLYLRKLSGNNLFVTAAMQRGHDLEPEAVAYAEMVHGKSYPKVTAVHDEHDWLMASFDGWNEADNEPLEIKCPGEIPDKPESARDWKKWYWQVQTQLCVANASKAILVVYSPDKQVETVVERNDEHIASLIEKAHEFYEYMTFQKDYPIPYQEMLSRDWFEASEAWKEAKASVQLAEEREKECKERLIALAGECSAKGNGVSLRRDNRRGVIEYAKIPGVKALKDQAAEMGLTDKDLDAYRKPMSVVWTPTLIKTL